MKDKPNQAERRLKRAKHALGRAKLEFIKAQMAVDGTAGNPRYRVQMLLGIVEVGFRPEVSFQEKRRTVLVSYYFSKVVYGKGPGIAQRLADSLAEILGVPQEIKRQNLRGEALAAALLSNFATVGKKPIRVILCGGGY